MSTNSAQDYLNQSARPTTPLPKKPVEVVKIEPATVSGLGEVLAEERSDGLQAGHEGSLAGQSADLDHLRAHALENHATTAALPAGGGDGRLETGLTVGSGDMGQEMRNAGQQQVPTESGDHSHSHSMFEMPQAEASYEQLRVEPEPEQALIDLTALPAEHPLSEQNPAHLEQQNGGSEQAVEEQLEAIYGEEGRAQHLAEVQEVVKEQYSPEAGVSGQDTAGSLWVQGISLFDLRGLTSADTANQIFMARKQADEDALEAAA